jgi:AcrR family transcriptional regulator
VTTTFGAKGRARRAELVGLGRRALVEGGLGGFVLRDVAARAGMTLGNLQYYFRSRDDLIEAVVRDAFAHDLAALRVAAVPDADDGRPPDLGELADLLRRQWAGDSGVVFSVLALLARHEDRFAALHQEVYAAFIAELTVLLRHADPAAGDGELAVRARLVTAVLDGLALQAVGAGPAGHPGADRAWEAGKALVAAVASGRAPAPGPPKA